jgi:hypothetical protein
VSPQFDDVFGAGALCALESDLTHPVLGACRATEARDAFIPQAPRGAAVVEFEWAHGGRGSVAASPELWFFLWLESGEARGAGLIAHLALVLEDWRVTEVRCVALNDHGVSLLRHCGFGPWVDGPPTERHLLTATALDVAPYVRDRDSPRNVSTGRPSAGGASGDSRNRNHDTERI